MTVGSKNKKASVLFLCTCIYVDTGFLPQTARHNQPWPSSKKAVNKAITRLQIKTDCSYHMQIYYSIVALEFALIKKNPVIWNNRNFFKIDVRLVRIWPVTRIAGDGSLHKCTGKDMRSKTGYTDKFCSFPQSRQENAGVVIKSGHDGFISRPFHFSVTWRPNIYDAYFECVSFLHTTYGNYCYMFQFKTQLH